MPVSKYFNGNGEKVMDNMKNEYGDKKGEQVFYATANKRKANLRKVRMSRNPASKGRNDVVPPARMK
jgi:hypothetical protein